MRRVDEIEHCVHTLLSLRELKTVSFASLTDALSKTGIRCS